MAIQACAEAPLPSGDGNTATSPGPSHGATDTRDFTANSITVKPIEDSEISVGETVPQEKEMQPPRVAKRPRGRPPKKNKDSTQKLENEDVDAGKPDRARKTRKKADVKAQSGAPGDDTAAVPPRQEPSPSGYRPGSHLQGWSPHVSNHPGVDPSASQPNNSYPTNSSNAPGAPGGFPKNPHSLRLYPQVPHVPGRYQPGSHLPGSHPQGLSSPGRYFPASQPRASYPTGSYTAYKTSGDLAKGPYTPGPYNSGGNQTAPPPPVANVPLQASPETGASGSSSTDYDAVGFPGMAPGLLSPFLVVEDSSGSPAAPRAVSRRHFLNIPQPVPDPQASDPGQARQPPQQPEDSRNDATGGPRLGHVPAQDATQNQQEGISEAGAIHISRLALPLVPIVGLRGQTLHIPNLDTVFQSWPEFQTNARMVTFMVEIRQTNEATYKNVAYLPDEVKLMIPTDPVSLASHLWPKANAHELRLAIEVVIWSTSWNIFLKKAARERPLDLRLRVDESKRIMRHLVENRNQTPTNEIGVWTAGRTAGLKFDDPIASIPRILQMLSALYDQDYLDVFKEDFCNYMDAITKEQRMLANGNIPRPEEYSQFYTKHAHVPPILRLTSLAAGELDRSSRRCALYEALLGQVNQIMRLTSDLYSVQEDMSMGNILNSFILRFAQCNNMEEAVRAVVDEIQQACKDFDYMAQYKLRAARRLGPSEEAQWREKLDALRQMCAGHKMWCIANKRHEVFKYKQDDGSFKIPLH